MGQISKAQIKAVNKYRAKNYKLYQFKLRKDTDAEIIKALDQKENKTAYIVGLIKKDLK